MAGLIATGRDLGRLVLDGSHGEGGGQILRTALALSVIAGRPFTLLNIRGGRPRPGLAAQHLTAVRAAAALCDAAVTGDDLGSQTLEFAPQSEVRSAPYVFDVAEQRPGGSAGSTLLVLQTVLLPLALAAGNSSVTVRGGTHMASSPSFDYARDAWLPLLGSMGVTAGLTLVRSGWFPLGKGEIQAEIAGMRRPLRPLVLRERGELERVWGRAVTANLPAHVAERMAGRAETLLAAHGIGARIAIDCGAAACAGAALFLGAAYPQGRAGATAMGARGKPAEVVADEAVAALLAFHRSGACIDAHLADQLILPTALAAGPSAFTVERATRHLATNAWVVEQFGLARVEISPADSGSALVTVTPSAKFLQPNPEIRESSPQCDGADLAAKVEFLHQASSYPEPTRQVTAIETHMSWVFLTDRHAYKLKKPVRFPFLDFSTLALRRHFCEEEIRLNKRLAPDVYIRAVPLARAGDGSFLLENAGTTVDWLVKMRRLPGDRMLDQAIRSGTLNEADIERVADRLAEFYRDAPPIEIRAADYLRRFERDAAGNRDELRRVSEMLPRDHVERVHAAQLALLRDAPDLFERRVEESRIIEAHGDLRPEHVFLAPEPQIIDCLEFNREFRLLDPVEEIAFLGIECELLGAAWIGDFVLERYRRATGDDPPRALIDFYKSYRAALRSKLAIWHLREPRIRDPQRWPVQARRYLELALRHAPTAAPR
jgi:RNA 3'-terminal phosphate cyclase (ATP)